MATIGLPQLLRNSVPLTLPNLDDLDWQQLTAEGTRLIPAWAPDWTNHNAADPGITLIELFAYICDILLYRVNRISDANLREFLRLLCGSESQPSTEDLHALIRKAALGVHEISRAITAKDFETLALVANQTLSLAQGERVTRVKCIPLRDLESASEGGVRGSASNVEPGHVSLVVLSNRREQPSDSLLHAIRVALEPARLLTTRIHVVRPRYVTFSICLTLVPNAGASVDTLRDDAVQALQRFFDPLQGGFDKQGWPFGRSVYLSDICQILTRLPGVDHITKTRNSKTDEEMETLVVGPSEATRLGRNQAGEQEVIMLDPDELPAAWVDRSDISIAELRDGQVG
jgi:hypothetical protein